MTHCHAPRCHKEADVIVKEDHKRIGYCEKHWIKKCKKEEDHFLTQIGLAVYETMWNPARGNEPLMCEVKK